MKWQDSLGIGGRIGSERLFELLSLPATDSDSDLKSGRFESECPAAFPRNGWQDYFGTGGRIGSEYSNNRTSSSF